MSGRRRPRRPVGADICVVLPLLAAATLAACGVPTDEQTFSEIPSDEIPFDLDATSTSTSSTTSTSAPPTTRPEVPDTTAATTTVPVPRLEPVEIYFLSRNRLVPVPLELPPGFAPEQVADVLEEGPPPGIGLDTLIEDGLIMAAVESGGVLTVDLDAEVFGRIASFDQAEAFGQIVTTMINSLNRVGQVTFTIDGEPIPVKKGNSVPTEAGAAVSYDDYVVLLAVSPTPGDETDEDNSDGTTTTVTTSTTEP